jgi:hypothetical protein
MATKNESNDKVITTAQLEVRGKTLVFDNTILQIPNISSIEIGELKKPFPQYIFWLVGASMLTFFFADDYWVIALILLGVAGKLTNDWVTYHVFGLIIRSNSGIATLIQNKNVDFLKDVALVLKNIMDSEEEKSVTFNLDKRTIVDNVSGSTVVLGNATGDIVNRV